WRARGDTDSFSDGNVRGGGAPGNSHRGGIRSPLTDAGGLPTRNRHHWDGAAIHTGGPGKNQSSYYTCNTPVWKGRPASCRVATASAVSNAARLSAGATI